MKIYLFKNIRRKNSYKNKILLCVFSHFVKTIEISKVVKRDIRVCFEDYKLSKLHRLKF